MTEKVLLKIENAEIKASSRGNVYLTDKRVIVERKGIGKTAGYFLGGIVGYAIVRRKGKKEAGEETNLTPDEILAANKKNFAINYSDIEKVKFAKLFTGGACFIIKPKGKRLWTNITFGSPEYLQKARDIFQKHSGAEIIWKLKS